MKALGAEEDVIDRVCYLVGHHHTYNQVDGLDYQILIEADFFVNAYEDNLSTEAMKKVYGQIFKTETGKKLFEKIYLSFSVAVCSFIVVTPYRNLANIFYCLCIMNMLTTCNYLEGFYK